MYVTYYGTTTSLSETFATSVVAITTTTAAFSKLNDATKQSSEATVLEEKFQRHGYCLMRTPCVNVYVKIDLFT